MPACGIGMTTVAWAELGMPLPISAAISSDTLTTMASEREQLESVIRGLEAQRGLLGDR